MMIRVVNEKTACDFYSGFEGEPEIVFSRLRADKTDLLFRLWGGHFEVIMGTLWTKYRDVILDDWPQLLRDWNEVTGYADTFDPREIEDLKRTAEALKRLTKEDLNEERGSLEKSWIIVGALIEFLEAAEDAHDLVTIAED